MLKLREISISNYKSFKHFNIKALHNLVLIIGANGSGKSNFLSALYFITHGASLGLQKHAKGNSLTSLDYLHLWDEKSVIEFEIALEHSENACFYQYNVSLAYKDENNLNVVSEKLINKNNQEVLFSSANSSEYQLALREEVISKEIHAFLFGIKIYSFYSTDFFTTKINKYSKHDYSKINKSFNNLVSVLYFLRQEFPLSYSTITNTIKIAIPYFVDFIFKEEDSILEMFISAKFKDEFSTTSLSDGTIRIIALITLLNMPVELRPSVLLLEEPEISLHPYIVELLADLITSYSVESQVFLVTQSNLLLNNITVDPTTNSVYVLDMDMQEGVSVVKKVDALKLEKWLKNYKLGDLWLKNLLGGTPI